MDITHLTTVHSTFDTRIFEKELKSLRAAGHDTTLLTYHDENTVREGVRIESLGTQPARFERLINLFGTYRHAKSLESDVYHIHDPELLPVGRALTHTTDASVIYDVHENFDHAVKFRPYIPDLLKQPVSRSVVPLQSALAASMDAIVTATEWIAADFERRGHDSVVTVRNYPILDDISLDKIEVERNNEYLLSFVGNLTDNRGLVRMIDVTRRLRDDGFDVGIWIVGPFVDDDIERRVKRKITEEGLEEHVRLFGYVEYEEVFSILHSSDIGLMLVDPSLYDRGLATKMFEYMSAEIPVIANRTQATKKYIPDSCGIVVDDIIERQVKAVKTLLHDGDRRSKMGANGRELAKTEYNWKVEKEKLLDLYSQLLPTSS